MGLEGGLDPAGGDKGDVASLGLKRASIQKDWAWWGEVLRGVEVGGEGEAVELWGEGGGL